MILEYAFDLALVFLSACSALYCWMLSRRLKALQNLRKGVGQAMVNLTKSVTAVEANAAKLNREATAAISELRIMLSRVDECEEEVDNLLQTMDRQSRETWREFRDKTGAATQSLDMAHRAVSEICSEARALSQQLSQQIVEARSLTPHRSKGEVGTSARPAVKAISDLSPREIALAKALAARRKKATDVAASDKSVEANVRAGG